MSEDSFYFSIQYSAIQKTVLRLERLWSIAGISQILSKLNEVELPQVSKKLGGEPLVAGGGKFTAKFKDEAIAKEASAEIIKAISTKLPMLEFQVSRILCARDFNAAKAETEIDGKDYPGILREIDEQKRCFRGYGVTYNPHLKVCEECGEYPAVESVYTGEGKKQLWCSICSQAKSAAKLNLNDSGENEGEKEFTTIEKIYRKYIEPFKNQNLKIPLDFEDLFPKSDKDDAKGNRIAVWFSDLNNMNQKVPLWLNQDERDIFDNFNQIKSKNIEVIGKALKETFPEESHVEKIFIPFRIIIAGGDDLCIIMPDKYILKFAESYSSEIHNMLQGLGQGHPIHSDWLKKAAEKMSAQEKKVDGDFKPYCFGASFIVTSAHTPFTKIHEIGEALMSEAKSLTDREWNSVNWLVMAEDEGAVFDKRIQFEKPVLIDNPNNKKNKTEHLYLKDYLDLCKKYERLSNSKIQQIASKVIEFENDSSLLEAWLKRHPDAKRKTTPLFNILSESYFRKNGQFRSERLATLLELLTIYRGNDTDE